MTSTKFVAVFSEGNLRHLKFLWSMLKALDTLILSEHQPGMLCYNVELRNGEAKVSSSGPCYKFLVLVWSYKLINFRAHLQFSIFKSLSSSSSSRPSLSRGTQTVFVLKRGSPSVKYIIRPVLPFGSGGEVGLCEAVSTRDSLHLGCYRMELVLNNMVYTAIITIP